ncbi:similar to Saccharomyces cerevisiae YLR361C-A Putative protein of unknown function [Maudiozyma barnettii]|uniref:Uncharacterized protein n=1 Tax=Maudiozyma barnettii TaxID=61262 RepID=A0A8H2ZKT1_9SACH|nr:hypothetical protein [Kazachstania barnettii]CAB4257283.1 similar to Saccharomyces cerevisiae YLR361C-A Putative protein of unknown function [Kazachstania barnettii]CAD1784548.1 similar to Saccharomyces cerevisiae YLR361C-A Putative protein of unknown function [Kazachstania barnettii]
MSQSNNTKQTADNNNTDDIPKTVEIHRAGKTKIISLEQLRKPHAITSSPEFLKNNPIRHEQGNNNDNAGGLLQTGNHRPTSDKK